MKAQNTVLHLFIGNSVVQNQTQNQIATSASGTLGIVAPDGKNLNALGDFRIALSDGSKAQMSEVITRSRIARAYAKRGTREKEKTTFIGFNGSSGSIQVINNNMYQVMVHVLEYGSFSVQNTYLRSAQAFTATGNTQNYIADELVRNFIINFSREPKKLIVERLTNATRGAAGTSGTLVFTPDSRVVTASAASAYSNVAVGGYLVTGVGNNFSVYKVESINSSSNTIILDVPYQGLSQVSVTATGNVFISSANASTANFGVKIQGAPQPFRAGFLRFNIVDFFVNLYNFGSTTITTEGGSKGEGSGKEVAELEWFVQGNFGEINRMGPNQYLYQPTYVAKQDSYYNSLTIHYSQKDDSGSLVNEESPRSLIIFVEEPMNSSTGLCNVTEINKLITHFNTVTGYSLQLFS